MLLNAHTTKTAVFALLVFVLGQCVVPAYATADQSLSDDEAPSYKVSCKVYVTAEGKPLSVQVLKVEPHSQFDAEVGKSVKQAVLSWDFTPNMKDGKPVAGFVSLPVWVN